MGVRRFSSPFYWHWTHNEDILSYGMYIHFRVARLAFHHANDEVLLLLLLFFVHICFPT